MIKICDKNKCTGCYACVNKCPHKCIDMIENTYGELHPYIDNDMCTKCGACIKACPNNINIDFYYPIRCFAAWISDKENRKLCSSGGIATILSDFVIKAKGGYVYGTAYDKDMIPRTTCGKTKEDIERFKGSKYVKSIVGANTFIDIKQHLENDTFILYIATPCQVAGLKSYLAKEYNNLITVDLICHGVCPTTYFKAELAYLKNKHKIDNITNVRFRGNDKNNFIVTVWNRNNIKYDGKNDYQYYLGGFLHGVSLRENCYSCNYARPERVSDITLGDFIGLGTKVNFPYSQRNVSSVTLNTHKAEFFYKDLTTDYGTEIINVERDYNERLAYKPSLKHSYPRHILNNTFKKNYLRYGFVKGIRRTLWKKNIAFYLFKHLNKTKYILQKCLMRYRIKQI